MTCTVKEIDRVKFVWGSWIDSSTWPPFMHPVCLIYFCLFHLQCSRLSYGCHLHPATTTTYTTWMRQKACVTSLTSPFSTSDTWDWCQIGKQLPFPANLPFFSLSFPTHWQWRCEEVLDCQYELMSVQGQLCTDTVSSSWARSDRSSMYSLMKKCRQEQRILFTAFPRKPSQNKLQIIIFLDSCVL